MDTSFIKKNAFLILLALIIVAVPSAFAYNYVQNDPRFCTTCHLMNTAVSTWNASAMHGLNCHTCHESDMLTNVGHLVSVVVEGKTEVTKPVVIDNQLCESCHANNDPKWLQVANTEGHKVHIFNETDPANCIECHGARLHVFSPPEEVCVKCHSVDKQIAEQTMGTHCATCHEFLATSGELVPENAKCLSCHPGKESMGVSFPNNAHSDGNCIDCHDPHKVSIFPDCTSCHAAGGGLHNVPAHNNCISCHLPHDGNQLRANCLSCHPDKEAHNPSEACQDCHYFKG